MEPTARPSPARRRGIASTPTSKASKKLAVYIGLAALLVAVAIVVGYRMFLSEKNRRHSYPVSWPRSAPEGEPVTIRHEVKEGDVFTTTTLSNVSIVLAVDSVDPKDDGMRLDVRYAARHVVEPREGGLRSRVTLTAERADSTYAPMKALIWVTLGGAEATQAYGVAYDRTPTGAPIPGTVTEFGGQPAQQRFVYDGTVCGLGDLATSWLPPRPVRIGDVWTMAECANVPNVTAVIKEVAEAKRAGGYPEPALRAEVAAEALERKDDEDCLRLRLVLYFTMEGEAKAPAVPGWISTAAFVNGHVWVSTATGLPWASELEAGITSSYAIANKTEERRAIQRIASRTVRGAEGVAHSAKK